VIDHTGFNVTNLALSREFYAKALAPLDYRICYEADDCAGFGAPQEGGDDPGGDFWIGPGEPQTPRMHVAFRAASKQQVQEFYRAAIEAGGADNGPPGERRRYHPGYHAAFVLDPDGHNIEAVFHA